jgi:GntR family transcriptional regulator, transcriptional repressor for pyruvate dehydrogenase complex
MAEVEIITTGVAKQIADKVRADILEGRLNPNEKLPTEEDMAARYGVSRPTVREALKRLSAQNLIRSKRGPGGGNFVNEATLDQLAPTITSAAMMLTTLGDVPMEQVFAARRELEGLCLRLAIERKDTTLPHHLSEVLAIQQDETTGDEAFCASDVQFHRLIVDACGNVIIRLALYAVIEALVPITNMIITRTRRRSEITDRHAALRGAIERGDTCAANAILMDLIAYHESEYAKSASRG